MKKLLMTLVAMISLYATAQTLPEEGKVYTILSKNYAGMYMSEEADGTLVVGSLDNARRQFWEFVPAEESGTYYIRNKVSGNYIQSCNGTNSSSSVMHTGTTPVAYYVGLRSSGNNAGYLWFSSTDCAGYNDQSATPHGLNKDGASNNVIIWNAGTGNNGSHWSIIETTFTYEIQPFTTSPSIGNPTSVYHLVNGGKYVSEALQLVDASEDDANNWYFVGESNAAGGYQIVNVATNTPIVAANGSDRWIVNEDVATSSFYFTSAADATVLFTASEATRFTLKNARSPFARHAQIYDLPCGALSNGMYISQASLAGDAATHKLTYPIRTQSGTVRSSTQQSVAPTSWYKLNVLDQAVLRRGRSCTLTLRLSKAPVGGESVYVYFDWNRDGVFETAYTLSADRDMEQKVDVPADAAIGKTRMRVRVTYNGLADAEDEVQGQCIDFAMEVVEDDGAESFTVTVRPNNPTRGTATIEDDIAVATPIGNATFLCWKEGHRYVSVSKNYRYGTPTHDLNLTAVFSAASDDPYGDNVLTAVPNVPLSELTEALEIGLESQQIVVRGAKEVYAICLYDLNGRLVRRSNSDILTTEGLPAGTYIAKAIALDQQASAKIQLIH